MTAKPNRGREKLNANMKARIERASIMLKRDGRKSKRKRTENSYAKGARFLDDDVPFTSADDVLLSEIGLGGVWGDE